jgi:hypothetical protein
MGWGSGGGRLTAIANLLSDIRAYKPVMKRVEYPHPAGLGVHILQINLLLQSYSHQSAMRLRVFAIVSKQRDGWEFNSRRGPALFNSAYRPALGYPRSNLSKRHRSLELRSLGVRLKKSGRVATHSSLPMPYVKKNWSFTSTSLYVISRVVLTF